MTISKSWIISCSILTGGIMTCAYLNSLSNLPLIHMKRKYRLELEQIKKSTNLIETNIKEENKIISYYWKHYNFVFIMGISGLSIIMFRTLVKK
jgi:hypothetical protein